MEFTTIKSLKFDDVNNMVYCTFVLKEKVGTGQFARHRQLRMKLTLKEFKTALQNKKIECVV